MPGRFPHGWMTWIILRTLEHSQITSSHGSQEEELSGSPRRIKMIQLPQMRNDPVPQVKEKRNSEEKCP
ncbi:hypothetical protein PV325_012913 [Microctonus aethiopoides]|nr:hypothetical protein PV325_012913 [Microctonus aethiopoides]